MQLELEFSGVMFEWRGPAPFYFVQVPERESEAIFEIAPTASYGWGAIPCGIRVGSNSTTTAVFPKDGHYLVPIKNAIRLPQSLEVGDEVAITLLIG